MAEVFQCDRCKKEYSKGKHYYYTVQEIDEEEPTQIFELCEKCTLAVKKVLLNYEADYDNEEEIKRKWQVRQQKR